MITIPHCYPVCVSVHSCNAAYKLDGVSTLYNVEFEKKELRVWKAYGLGPGRLRTEEYS